LTEVVFKKPVFAFYQKPGQPFDRLTEVDQVD